MKKISKEIIIDKFIGYGTKEAIIYGKESISYQGLINRIEEVKENLNNIGLNSIAICMDNKIELISLCFACIVSKISFIVVDKDYPKDYLERILREARSEIVVCDQEIEIKNINCIQFHKLKNFSKCKKSDRCSVLEHDVIFYIATSGSSGKPKVAERCWSTFWEDYKALKNKHPYLFGKVAQQYAKLNFSYGLENSLLLLMGGTTVCFSNQSMGVKNIEQMYSEIKMNRASIVFWSTPIIKLLSKHYRLCSGIPECIEYIYTGGEPLVISADLIVEFHNRNITLINDYGCSEIGKIFTNSYKIQLRDIQKYNMVGVGKALKGYEAIILDQELNETQKGDLYLKSRVKFPCRYVDKSLKTGEIKKENYWLYKLNDIAKYENDEIIILGREMNSVNVAGYRIELEQIEYVISQIENIDLCVVVPVYNDYKEAILYCFYTGTIDNQELRKKLSEKIPDYMIPNVFVKTKKIFLLPNGKIDRKKNNRIYAESNNFNSDEECGIKDRIYQYLKRIIGNRSGSFNEICFKPFSDYGVDSLLLVDFLSTVEEKEKVLIKSDDIGIRIKCLNDIVVLVCNANKYLNGE